MRLHKVANVALRPLGFKPKPSQPKDWPRMPPLHRDHVRRIRYFQHLVELIEYVPGDIVECGVEEGASLLMLAALTEGGRFPRRVWGFDSFEGLPAPAPQDEPEREPELIQ